MKIAPMVLASLVAPGSEHRPGVRTQVMRAALDILALNCYQSKKPFQTLEPGASDGLTTTQAALE